jgi:hypothetical protein
MSRELFIFTAAMNDFKTRGDEAQRAESRGSVTLMYSSLRCAGSLD